MRKLTIAFGIAAVMFGCKSNSPQPAGSAAPLSSGIDLAGMDKAVAPGDDFNAYTNGGWIKSTPIPPDKASYGLFTIMADETRKRTASLIQESAGMVGDYYSSYMD